MCNGFMNESAGYMAIRLEEKDGFVKTILKNSEESLELIMYEWPWGVKSYGKIDDGYVKGEGAIIDINGISLGEGIFEGNWLKHKGKHI